MIEETWKFELGDRAMEVPRLPFKFSRKIYPICQKLSNAGLVERIYGTFKDGAFTPPPPMQLTDEELEQLSMVALVMCQAADQSVTEDAFNEMPIAPSQLYDTFFAARKACGGWRVQEGQKSSGEETKMEEPPT